MSSQCAMFISSLGYSITVGTYTLLKTETSVADPDPGSSAFLTPGSGMGKKSGSGSGMNNPDHISESLETIFWVKVLKFFDADPGFGKENIRI